ncbi:hypothetical protein J2Y66_000463 [Paenarthrobacter nitroguajacolicus]|uniref:hypothetical protein n=1 Tax=Paenarthrobacter TaxID=1742992 RepID=UPI00285F2C43|nr:hypothetical protein [Paenarthrobacter nitroguajacolicus]MDR6986000.1 hypothetical protein [Paenarthrobacter nitroguajacolicus]
MSTTNVVRVLDITMWVMIVLSLVLLVSGLLDNFWATVCLIAVAAPSITSWVIKDRARGATKGDEPQ